MEIVISPRLARGFFFVFRISKATTKTVVANFILPLILQTLGGIFIDQIRDMINTNTMIRGNTKVI